MARWTLRIPDELARRVEERLEENCQRRDAVLRYLLERYLEMPPWTDSVTESEAPAKANSRSAPAAAPKRSVRPAPLREQLAEAQRLADELGIEIPEEALAFRSACSDFIRKAKEQGQWEG